MVTVLFTPKEFPLVNLLPQGTQFTAAHFIDNVIIPLANRPAQQWEDITRRKTVFAFRRFQVPHCSACPRTDGQYWCVRVPHPPYSPDLAIADFYLFR
jgi:hypothetical protein